MTEFTIVRHAAAARSIAGQQPVKLAVDRATLAKRRWRGAAEDGHEFGFDLEHPLTHGAVILIADSAYYQVQQAPEEVLEIPVGSIEQAARVAWSLGNLHFPVQVLVESVRVADDPAVRQFLSRENIPHGRVTCVFLPLAAVHHHHA